MTSKVVLAIATYATLYVFFSNDLGHHTAAIMKFSTANTQNAQVSASFTGLWRKTIKAARLKQMFSLEREVLGMLI